MKCLLPFESNLLNVNQGIYFSSSRPNILRRRWNLFVKPSRSLTICISMVYWTVNSGGCEVPSPNLSLHLWSSTSNTSRWNLRRRVSYPTNRQVWPWLLWRHTVRLPNESKKIYPFVFQLYTVISGQRGMQPPTSGKKKFGHLLVPKLILLRHPLTEILTK